MTLTLFSPAKVNLFFRVLKRRDDGYHEIASLFQAINLGDKLTLALASEDQLTCSDPSLACDSSNLVQKAIDLFRMKTCLQFGVRVHLEKKIPIQSGLGGGSSNAATTLWGLNVLHDYPVSTQTLQMWSKEIGSDIPFFFSEGTAYCRGRGENVLNLFPWETQKSLYLFKPEGGLSTPVVYNALDLQTCFYMDPERLLDSFQTESPIFHNDLEQPAFSVFPELSTWKNRFIKKGFEVVMTGSGTAFLLIGKGDLEEDDKPIFHIKTTNRLPKNWYPFPS